MNSAVIIFSEDNLFIKYSLMKLREDHVDSIIERSINVDDFIVLIEEFLSEGLSEIKVICDGNSSLNDINEIEEIIEKYSKTINFSYSKGIEDLFYFHEN